MKKKILSILVMFAVAFSITTPLGIGAEAASSSSTAFVEPNITMSVSRPTARRGQEFTLSASFNDTIGINSLSSATVSINYDGLTLISGLEGGNITLGTSYPYRFYVPEDAEDRYHITFTVNYVATYYTYNLQSDTYEANNVTGSKKMTTTINVVDSNAIITNVPPVIENLRVPFETEKNESFEISVDVFNYGTHELSQAALTVTDKAGNLLTREYIGFIAEGDVSRYDLVIPEGISEGGENTINVAFDYVDKDKGKQTLKTSAKISVKGESGEGEGYLSLQRINSPLKVLIDTRTTATISLTNSSSSDIKDIEVFLYDDAGRLLTSDYIPIIEAKTIKDVPLEFPVSDRAGVRSYSISVEYKNNNENRKLSGSFSLISSEEDPNDKPPEEVEKPSSIRIQSVNAPPQIYSGVRTDIPFKLVNAGKGTAYNVEVFVTDADGREIAREYIGSIPPSGGGDGVIPLRFNDIDTYDLTFHAIAENADDSTLTVNKKFELKVMNYRVSITDVAGYEWIWNNLATIEFAVINGGTETMLNTSAVLTDAQGTIFKDVYIGNIAPGEKRERIRFRDAYIFNANGEPEIEFWGEDDGDFGFYESFEFEDAVNSGGAVVAVDLGVRVDYAVVSPRGGGGGSPGEETMELFIVVTFENADMHEFSTSYSMFATLYSESGMWDTPEIWDPGSEIVPEELQDGGISVVLLIVIIGGGVLILAAVVVVIIILKKKKTGEDDDIDYFLSQIKKEKSSTANSSTDSGNRNGSFDSEKEEITQ
ncbi:MAG: hypothetical protein FWG70_04830 [Oscillospiraceae bacterium]|nr:hypothetical protein [Oscillospiraceae bacterium]